MIARRPPPPPAKLPPAEPPPPPPPVSKLSLLHSLACLIYAASLAALARE